jgi:hypothetical protein
MPRALKFDLRAKKISELGLDAERVFTSKPYPLSIIEGLATAHSLMTGLLWRHPLDELGTTHDFAEGQLRTIQQRYDFVPESVDTQHALLSGELRQIIKSYSFQPEILDTLHTLVSGVLDLVLITYDGWPAEAMDTAHSFVSGALA